MKTLILIRHGKSSWSYDVKDAERPLKKRAAADAEKVISGFKIFYKTNTTVWSSYARRALGTASIFKEELGIEDEKFSVREDLYTFDPENLLSIITSCDNNIENLMLFGHNPAFTEVANTLGDQVFDNIPTTGLVQIEFQADSWKELVGGETKLFLFPKNL